MRKKTKKKKTYSKTGLVDALSLMNTYTEFPKW